MRLFIDTEFTDFDKMDLISIGIVSEDGLHEFYAENLSHIADYRSQFVNDVVMPLTDMSKYGKTYPMIALDLVDWLDQLPEGPHEMIVDYAGDWQLFANLIKRAGTKPKHLPSGLYLNHALIEHIEKTHGKVAENFHGAMNIMLVDACEQWFAQDPRRHHALVDARANRFAWLEVFREAEGWVV